MTTYIAVMNWDNATKHVTKSQLFSTLAEAQGFVLARGGIFPGTRLEAFACQVPNGFKEATWKVNAANNGLEIDQSAADAKAALATALAAEATRVQGFLNHADFQAVLQQLKTATATQVIDALTADLTAATTLGQVKTVVGTYLAKIILVEAAIVKRINL